MGQAITTGQFYFYGKKHFTRTGWLKASATYEAGFLEGQDLKGKVYAVTGANSGIGLEISKYLASKGGTLYMVCRNPERGEQARTALVEETKSDDIHLLVGDVSLASDVHRLVKEMSEGTKRLDALVCNAGALLNKKQTTSEGHEVTFACHLLNGSYLLSSLLMPMLKSTPDSRVVMVTSGGMLNTKWPKWETATSQKSYDGQLAYCFAKRGQVLLAERWAATKEHAPVKVVSAHPGWTKTPGVSAAYGSKQSYLEPLRSTWEGSEGISWCCVCPQAELEDGAFYLDRKPWPKYLPGFMWGEKTSTMNTSDEVDTLMAQLKANTESAAQ